MTGTIFPRDALTQYQTTVAIRSHFSNRTNENVISDHILIHPNRHLRCLSSQTASRPPPPPPHTRCITSQTRALWQWRWRRVCLASISFSGHIRPPSSPKSQHPSLLPNHAQHSIQCQCQVPPVDPSEATYLLAVSLSHETQLEIRLGT